MKFLIAVLAVTFCFSTFSQTDAPPVTPAPPAPSDTSTNGTPSTNQPSSEQRKDLKKAHDEIVKVIVQQRSAFTNCARFIQTKDGNRWVQFSDKDYISGLHRIPVVRCPQKFRLAWSDYVQTWERKMEQGMLGKAVDVAELALAAKSGSGKVADDALERMKKLDNAEAWRQVERLALEYDIQFRPMNYDWETFQHLPGGIYRTPALLKTEKK
jgi:hypothetical protein